MKVVEFAKSHPWMTAGGVAVVGLILILVLSSGGDTEAVADPQLGGYQPYNDPAATAANAALVQTQIAGQIASKQSDNALAAIQSENDTAAKIAKMQFDFQQNAVAINGDVSKAAIAGEVTQALYAKETTLGVAKYQHDLGVTQATSAQTVALAGFDRDKYIADAAKVVAVTTSTDNKLVQLANIEAYKGVNLAGIASNERIELEKLKAAPTVKPVVAKYTPDQLAANSGALAKQIASLTPGVAQGGTFGKEDIYRAITAYQGNFGYFDAKV